MGNRPATGSTPPVRLVVAGIESIGMDENPYQAPQFKELLPRSTRPTFWRRARRLGFWTGVAGLIGILGFGFLAFQFGSTIQESWLTRVLVVNVLGCMVLAAVGALVLMVAGTIDHSEHSERWANGDPGSLDAIWTQLGRKQFEFCVQE